MKNSILAVLLISISLPAYFAQDVSNMILNPSFESMNGKLKKLKQINVASEWDSPTALKADLYSTEKDLPVSAPSNQRGKEFPMDGENYAGILAYSYNNKEPRTYIQTQLLSPMSKGVEYCIKFNVSLSDLSKYAINNLGMYMGKEPLYLESKGDLIFQKESEFSNVATNVENKVYNARYNWESVCAMYKSNGKEQYITIGNFFNNKDVKVEKLAKLDGFSGSQLPSAYYYIDQVEVFLIEDIADCDCSNQMDNVNTSSIIYHKDLVKQDGIYSIEELVNMGTVYFDVTRASIDKMFVEGLNKMVTLLKENPEINIELHGHTDKMEFSSIKKDPENELLINLGIRRADKVKAFLVKNGISEERLSTMNHDASQPASARYSELSLAKNRRVEFKIVE
ncbi:MAG: OmpA family protein [Flavobacteriales bacterium]|nr:OmpA family protein [Flavobacteriales bacterium]